MFIPGDQHRSYQSHFPWDSRLGQKDAKSLYASMRVVDTRMTRFFGMVTIWWMLMVSSRIDHPDYSWLFQIFETQKKRIQWCLPCLVVGMVLIESRQRAFHWLGHGLQDLFFVSGMHVVKRIYHLSQQVGNPVVFYVNSLSEPQINKPLWGTRYTI